MGFTDSQNSPVLPPIQDILPDEPLLLMGAGPVPVAPSVAKANSIIINHLGPTMSEVILGVRSLAQYVFQTESDKIIGVAGPASSAMEMTITNLLWPGRRALVIANGTFGERWVEVAQRVGADVTVLRKAQDIAPHTLSDVQKAYQDTNYDVLIAVHGETSTGVLLSDLPAIAQFAHRKGSLVIVDAVTTLGALQFDMDGWEIAGVVAGGQKALGSIPGISLVAFSEEAWHVIENRPASKLMPHWCLDARLAWRFWGEGTYHYTAPVPGVLSLYQALWLIKDEGLDNRAKRHIKSSKMLQNKLQALELQLFAPDSVRLPTVVSIRVPVGANGDHIRAHMREKHGIEISGAFGHNIIRVGQMSEQCRPERVERTVNALSEALRAVMKA